MDRRGISVTFVALMLAVLMTSSTTATPGMGVMQTSPGSEDGQPDAENNTLYVFGNPQLSNCYSKFNNTDADSAPYGEDSRGSSGILDIKVTCRMEPTLDTDVMLKEGEMINAKFTVDLAGAWTNGENGCNGDCENLNISFLKGNRVVAIKEFDTLGQGENSIMWDVPVTEDLLTWNGSQETMGVEFTMKLRPVEGFLIGGQDAEFLLYYTHPENPPERNASVTFPILNQTAVDELTDDGSMSGGDDAGLLPGFTAMVGIGGLAAAALLRGNEDEE